MYYNVTNKKCGSKLVEIIKRCGGDGLLIEVIPFAYYGVLSTNFRTYLLHYREYLLAFVSEKGLLFIT